MSMPAQPDGPCRTFAITRENLGDGSLMSALRATAPPGTTMRSPTELAATLDTALLGQKDGADIHVFGYGSLMWNPAIHYAESMRASVQGWHRRFCLRLYMARGSMQTPGLMLALDQGGSCDGVVFRIAGERAREELSVLWQREMMSGTYHARWVDAITPAGPVPALTFVANREHVRYTGELSDAEAAHFIATGHGSLGSCAEYFENTAHALRDLGIEDASIARLALALKAATAAAVAPSAPV
jgi:cation transport protein ChaC